MKTRVIILLTGVCLLSLSSCIKDLLCVNGNGIIKEEKRRVTSFDQLDNSTSITVVYKKADTLGVVVEADQNLLEKIETNVSSKCLEIRTSPGTLCLDYTRSPVITVSSPALWKAVITGSGRFSADKMAGENVILKVTGSGDISVKSVTCDESQLTITGSGNINVTDMKCVNSDILITGSGNTWVEGNCETSNLRITGSGRIFSNNLPVKSAYVNISGSGDAYTNVEEYLNGLISGSGNIYVEGDPQVDEKITGSGRIIKNK
jgi:hypothetical protein